MKKIHCEEITMETPDKKFTLDEVRDMIGFYEPSDDVRKGSFEVTMIEGGYTAETQFEAQVISSLEEIKALLLKIFK